MDLLGVTGQRPNLPIAVCCSSRDELDALCSVVSNLSYISLSILVYFVILIFSSYWCW